MLGATPLMNGENQGENTYLSKRQARNWMRRRLASGAAGDGEQRKGTEAGGSAPVFLLPERKLRKYSKRVHGATCHFYVFSTFHDP